MARRVAIVPILSATAEHVISQVKHTIEAVGESGLEETLESRIF